MSADCSLVAYNTLTACKAEMKRLTEKLTFHTATYTAKDVSTIRTCSISAFVLALVVVGICWRCSSVKAAKKHAEHLEQLQQQAKQQVQQLHQRHVQELEDVSAAVKRVSASQQGPGSLYTQFNCYRSKLQVKAAAAHAYSSRCTTAVGHITAPVSVQNLTIR